MSPSPSPRASPSAAEDGEIVEPVTAAPPSPPANANPYADPFPTSRSVFPFSPVFAPPAPAQAPFRAPPPPAFVYRAPVPAADPPRFAHPPPHGYAADPPPPPHPHYHPFPSDLAYMPPFAPAQQPPAPAPVPHADLPPPDPFQHPRLPVPRPAPPDREMPPPPVAPEHAFETCPPPRLAFHHAFGTSPVTPPESDDLAPVREPPRTDAAQATHAAGTLQARGDAVAELPRSPNAQAGSEIVAPAAERCQIGEERNMRAEAGHIVEPSGYVESVDNRAQGSHEQGGAYAPFVTAANGQLLPPAFGLVSPGSVPRLQPADRGSSTAAEKKAQLVQRVDQEDVSHQTYELFRNGPSLMRQIDDSPRPVLVQEPEEGLPEPPMQVGRSPERACAKPVKKASLLELRKKVLLSIMQKKKDTASETEARMTDDASFPQESQESMQDAASPPSARPEIIPEVARSVKHPGTSLQLPVAPNSLQYSHLSRTRLIVEVSESESEDASGDDSEEDASGQHERANQSTKTTTWRPLERKRLRHQIIEDMKIRLVQLGRCPSSLHGKQPQSTQAGIAKQKVEARLLNGKREESASKSQDKITPVIHADRTALHNAKEGTKSEAILENSQYSLSPTGACPSSGQCGVGPEQTMQVQDRKAEDIIEHSSSSITASPARQDVLPTVEPQQQAPDVSQPTARIPVQLPIAKKTNLGKNEIHALRKRIATLEQARNAQKRTLTVQKLTNIPSNVMSLRPGKSESVNIDVTGKGSSVAGVRRSAVVPAGLACATDVKEDKANLPGSKDKGRYYSDEMLRKRSPERNATPERKCSPGTFDTAEQGAWNHRRTEGIVASVEPDRAEAGLVDDLKSELETSKRQLAATCDYSKLVLASDVSLAQAAAKLEFKRNALANLQELLKRAQFEVLDAEQDFEKIASAAKRMRESLSDGPFADMFPMPDIPTTKVGGGTPSRPLAEGSGTVRDSEAGAQMEADVSDSMEVELDLYTRSDLVLQQSPYSPSTGDVFSSCLSGLRAFVLRVPHHSQAADRKSMSPLSLTWTHNLDPMKTICPKELRRQYSCTDKKCQYEHLRNFESRTGHALDVVDRVQGFGDMEKMPNAEKEVVRAKIEIYSHKNVDDTVSSLISSLFDPATKLPFSRSVK